MKNTFIRQTLFAILWLLALETNSRDIQLSWLQFRQLSTLNGLPTNEVRRIYQDKEGHIWIATTSGLCQYDGYQLKTYKTNLYTPQRLSNNNIRCLSEDTDHNVWIGTNNGVNIMNKLTGEFRELSDHRFHNNVINAIYTTSTGITYIGSDKGLFPLPGRDRLLLYIRPGKHEGGSRPLQYTAPL
ncbi:MAG: hypothetical protein LUD15_12300 [Bacteroides sp.]|nr:hypothetical protein [Bacteroides sp.]